MRLDEFQQIIARHKGLRDDPAILDAEVEGKDKFNRPGKVPNPTPTYRYIFNDGTTLEARSQAGGDIQITNPGTAENKAGVQDAATDPNKAPETKTFPDGTERQWDPAKRDWVIIATKPQGPTQTEVKPGTAPTDLNLPSRPGQLTDLSLVEAQYKQFVAGVNADTNLTPQQRSAKIQTYLQTVVQPQADQATKEANAYQQTQQQRQQQTDTIAQQAAARANRTEDRQSTTAERQTKTAEDRLALDTQTASYNRGQDAVSNALKLLQYQVDPSFSPALAGVYNRIIPGAFQPNSFQTALPDLDAIAQAHIGPLLDMHARPVTGPSAQGASSAVAQPGQPNPLANVPITPRAPYPQPGGTGVVGRFGQ